MKFLRNLALGVLLATTQFVSAASCDPCDPCDPCNTTTECDLCNVDFCDMEFELYVDALYWHGNVDRFLVYGIDVSPDYSWGWRVGASAYWNTWDFGVRYTSIDMSGEQTEFDDEFSGVDRVKIDYQVFDLEVGRACCLCEGFLLRLFVGGKFADITHSEEQFENGSLDILEKIEFDGCGYYVGADVRWQICSFDLCDYSIPVAFVSRVSTGVMDGDFERISTDDEIEARNECQFVPTHELYAGLEFRMCDLCGIEGFMQLGYEAQYWGFRDVESNDEPTHLGLGGLVLRFGANF